MNELINNEQQIRLNRVHNEEDNQLIGAGGYLSPNDAFIQ